MGLRSLRIGYVLNRFPTLSETFILNEVLGLEQQGVPLEIFSLERPLEEPRHGGLKKVRTPVTYLPEDGLPEWPIGEGRYGEGTFQERPFKEWFQGDRRKRIPELFAFPHVLTKLTKQVRKVEDFLIFAAQVKAIPQAMALAALAKLKGVEHFHAHFGQEATTVAMLASRLTDIPYSFTAHAYDIYDDLRVDQELLKEKVRQARFVVTVCDHNRRVLTTLCGQKVARKIIRIYNGIDIAQFRPDPSVARQPGLILAVGRLVVKKGFRDLVRACRFLQDNGTSFKCLIVGEGEERDCLNQQISALGLKDRVTLLGPQTQEHVLKLMREATVLVLPCVVSPSGNQDGLPSVLIEALAVGLPAISTTLSGVPEIIEHGRTGLLIVPGDSMSLASAIEQVFGNPGLRERLARAGLRKVRAQFDVRKTAMALRSHLARSMPSLNRSRAWNRKDPDVSH
jgi:glycosyltransferase involved in cell wall biosynthesis